jgi:uncharacterized membrane protein
MRNQIKAVLLAVSLPLLMAHGEGGGCGDHADEVVGEKTSAACSDGSSLTYESFGRAFMSSYCTGCHSSALAGEARHGAPAYHDFDTLMGIRAVADHIDQMAGAGPAAINVQMPPSGAGPSEKERRQLSEWLACGAP